MYLLVHLQIGSGYIKVVLLQIVVCKQLPGVGLELAALGLLKEHLDLLFKSGSQRGIA